jgi:hypothetical protein
VIPNDVGPAGKLRKHQPTESLTSVTVPLSTLLPMLMLRHEDPYHDIIAVLATFYADVWAKSGDSHPLDFMWLPSQTQG